MKLEKSDLQLETIVTRIRDHQLDLQPDFQRGEIWDAKRRQRLIDTILRKWYVPAIHIVVDPDGEEVVLDGQQRLVAIRDFFADLFKIDGTVEPDDQSISTLHGLKYSQLPQSVRNAVNRFVLPVITLTEYRPQEPNELFFRLNQSYNLTPPEKRNALHGQARDQVKQLVRDLGRSGLLDSAKVGFSNGRLAYDDIIARSCVAIELGTLRKHINNIVVEDFYRARPFSESTIEGVRRSSEELMRQIDSAGARIKFNKGTLQTWLIYCFWAPQVTGNLPRRLLGRFEENRALVKKGGAGSEVSFGRSLVEILRVYDDRASYRVTDVSSVLLRDLAIHIFSQTEFETPPRRRSDDLVQRLSLDSSAAQALMSEYMDQVQWGNDLVDGGLAT